MAATATATATSRPRAPLRLLLPLLLLLAGTAAGAEDDFAFESGPDDEAGAAEAAAPGLAAGAGTAAPVRRQWGVADAVAVVGRLFRLPIPDNAFSGDVRTYELAKGAPAWLRLDAAARALEGVPAAADAGDHYVTLRARGAAGDAAKDVFAIEVRLRPLTVKELRTEAHCGPKEDPVVVTVLLDAVLEQLTAAQRVAAVRNAAGFLALSPSALWLAPQRGGGGGGGGGHPAAAGSAARDDLLSAAVVAAGPGDARRQTAPESTALRWAAGCGRGHAHAAHAAHAQLQAQARDGTLAEVLGVPVIGWHARVHGGGGGVAGAAGAAPARERRELGSGDSAVDDDDASYNYEDEGGDDGDGEEGVPEARVVPTMSSPVFPDATALPEPEHPHRHHHGDPAPPPLLAPEEELQPSSSLHATYHLPTSPIMYPAGTIVATPTLVPVRPTLLASAGEPLQPSRAYTHLAEVTPSATPVFFTEVEPSASTDQPSSQFTEPLPSSSSATSLSSSSSTSSSTSGSTSETSAATTGSSPYSPPSSPASTEPTSSSPEDTDSPSPPSPPLPPSPSLPTFPTERPTTEKTDYGAKNNVPTLVHRLPKQAAIAGKLFRYQIPRETFQDIEDGDTQNLRLIFMHTNRTSVTPTFWTQFDIEKQEVYALPLEEQVSKWEFLLDAMDKEGATVTESLALQVHHHKGHRAVNHEFSISLRTPDRIHYASNLDWEIELLNGIARTLGDPDISQITVRQVNVSVEPNVFSWANDSLPRSHCPEDDIKKIYQVLTKDTKSGVPSERLKSSVPPHLQLRKVTYRGLGQCERPIRPEILPGPPQRPPTVNFPPVTRNQMDRIDAIVGQLLVEKVPPDMFYDPELLPLKVVLMTIDNQPIPQRSWLQFDTKNHEFYGVPMPGDEGRKEYNLVCEDSEGQKANDVLEVVVHPAPRVPYSVEFSMTLDVPYDTFVLSASVKRRFLERLADLFGDRDASAIVLNAVSEGSTVVTWYNASLPTQRCPEREVAALRRLLLDDEERISSRVRAVMGIEFPVERVGLLPLGACLGSLTVVHAPDPDAGPASPGDDSVPPVDGTVPVTSTNEYLVNYIVPAVIIVCMLLLAGIVACVLYRRHRTGKMSVGDEDERQSFRNKGIPVIFQDELDERPEPANKSPVIMKEEKPPLPPPEYQRGGEGGGDRGTPPPSSAVAAARRPLLGPDGSPAPAPEDPPYQPPPPFTSSRDSGRGARPKPTPTYRKPPPYVPP